MGLFSAASTKGPAAASGTELEVVVGSSTEDQKVTLVWKDITCSVSNGAKARVVLLFTDGSGPNSPSSRTDTLPQVLLNSVSGEISGGFYAVMGPSGSGKTTLLNCLACRLDSGTKLTGELRLNGQRYSMHELKKHAGYVMQDDLLNGALTVLETATYCAELRLPRSMSKAERSARVDLCLDQMGLTRVRNVIVGSPLRKGISGGERKRLCVAMELLTKPLLLFLDEPTSGLDSVTALSLCRRLRELASTGECTVVCTIHQPQAKIFRLFGCLILLKAGRIVYQGPSEGAERYFSGLGYPLPPNENPADFFLDCITPETTASVEMLVELDNHLLSGGFNSPEVNLDAGLERVMKPRESTPWSHQFRVLFRRTVKEQFRAWPMLATQLFQTVLMSVLIGTAFLKIGTSETSIVRRQPVLFFCVVNQGIFSSLIVINVFPRECMLVLRERAAGTYYVSAYYLAKSLAEILISLMYPIIFTITLYHLVGFHDTPNQFFIFMGFMCLCSTAATSLALMVSALARTTDMSVTILPLMLELIALALTPQLTRTDVGISLNELQNLHLYCSAAKLAASGGKCASMHGEDKIKELGLDEYTVGFCAGILVLYIFFCRTVAFLGVRFIKH